VKLFLFNLFLWFSGNADKADCVADSAKAVIESYSSKETILDVYSSKDSKGEEIIAPYLNLPDLLMEPLQMPILTPLPIFPINPLPVTEVNP
jgi:hypothetical protein